MWVKGPHRDRVVQRAAFSSPTTAAALSQRTVSVRVDPERAGFRRCAAPPIDAVSPSAADIAAAAAALVRPPFGGGWSDASRMDEYYQTLEQTHQGAYRGVSERNLARARGEESSASRAVLESAIAREETRNIELRRSLRSRAAAPRASSPARDDAAARATMCALRVREEEVAAAEAVGDTQLLLSHTQGEIDRIATTLAGYREARAATQRKLEEARGREAALALIAKELRPVAARMGLVHAEHLPPGSPPPLRHARGVVPLRAAETLIGKATALFIPAASVTSVAGGGSLSEYAHEKMRRY